MTEVRIRQRNQLTVPVDIARAAGLASGSLCHMEYANGVITITPADAPHMRPLETFAGIARGSWDSASDAVETQISADRESWQR
jgi:hypothetical protein